MAKASSTVEIHAPLQNVYAVITDFDHYTEFVSGTKSVKVLKRKGSSLEVEFKLDVIKTITYSLQIELGAPRGFSWTLIKGDLMKKNSGQWILEEIKKGVTRATYEIEMDFGLLVPSSVTKILIEKNLPKMMQEFKARAEA